MARRRGRRSGGGIARGVGAALAAAVLAGVGAAPRARAEEPPPLVASGEKLYVRHCAVCHGRSGAGDGPFRGVLRVAPADLTRIAERHGGVFPDAWVAGHVDGRFEVPAHGPREMPVWGRRLGEPVAEGTQPDDVVRGEILALLEYLKTLQRAEPRPGGAP